MSKQKQAGGKVMQEENFKVKSFDQNLYATKKTVAQGMLDVALLSSNASQLKYVLQIGSQHEFYSVLIVLITSSILLQVALGIMELLLNMLKAREGCLDDPQRRRRVTARTEQITIMAMSLIVVANIFVGAFDSSNASYLITGLLFVVLGSMNINKTKERSLALLLNDITVIIIFLVSVINVIAGSFFVIAASCLGKKGYDRFGLPFLMDLFGSGILALLIICQLFVMSIGIDPTHGRNSQHARDWIK